MIPTPIPIPSLYDKILVVNDDSQAVVTTPNNPIYYVIDKNIFYQIDSVARTRTLIFKDLMRVIPNIVI